jgi:hypothetical protein
MMLKNIILFFRKTFDKYIKNSVLNTMLYLDIIVFLVYLKLHSKPKIL